MEKRMFVIKGKFYRLLFDKPLKKLTRKQKAFFDEVNEFFGKDLNVS